MHILQQPRELPRRVDAALLAEEEAEVTGSLPLSLLSRLAENLASSRGEARVRLKFSRDGEKRCLVTGELDSEVQVFCQRCLQPMALGLTLRMQWCLVRDDAEAKHLPRRLEPVLIPADSRLDLHRAVEDEILLGLPSVCQHQPRHCQLPEQYLCPEAQSGLHRPFAALAEQ